MPTFMLLIWDSPNAARQLSPEEAGAPVGRKVSHDASFGTRVIAAFGGVQKMKRALGHKNPTTVQGWHERGHIPVHLLADIRKAAARLGVTLPDDFPDGETLHKFATVFSKGGVR